MDDRLVTQSADKIAPRSGSLITLLVDATSRPYDIFGDGTLAHPGLLPRAQGKIVEIICNQTLFYRCGDIDTEVVDGTALSPSANAAFMLAAGSSVEFVLTGRYLITQASAGGILYLAITSGVSRQSSKSG